jgi:competence protein ComGC
MKNLALAMQEKRYDRGFTLVELMVAIVLSMFVLLGGGEMLRQLIVASAHNADETVAIIQVQNAGFWVGQDAVQAQDVKTGDPAIEFVRLSWTDWDSTDHVITYYMVDAEDEVGDPLWELMRHDSVTDETVMISEFLVPAGTSCAWDAVAGVLTMNAASRVGSKSETATFDVRPRSIG